MLQKLGGLTGLAQGSLATSADIQANTNAVDDDALLVHVRAKIPAGAALGEAHIIAKRLGLTTYVTFPGHGLAPFTLIFRRSDSGSITDSAGDVRSSVLVSIADAYWGTTRPPAKRRYNAES